MNATRSSLVLGLVGAGFFVIAGVVGLLGGFAPLPALFLVIGVAGLVGGSMLWRRI